MNKSLYFFGVALLAILGACRNEISPVGFQPDSTEYLPLLEAPQADPVAENASMIQFWSNRLDADSTGVGELGPLGAAYEARFQLTGDYQDLDRAKTLYGLGTKYSAHQKDQFIRHTARVAISQHDFANAYQMLDSLLASGSQNRQTRLQLFDAAMEVANFKVADSLLTVLEDPGDFNYLIRAAKWNDHRGDLDTAINYMEQARQLAEAKDSPPLLEWVYSNLATFYGHAGRLEASYRLNLEVLKINPRHVQSLKQLAWLEYSSALNPDAALAILSYAEEVNKSLDLLLLKAEILEFTDQAEEAIALRKLFVDQVLAKDLSPLFANELIKLWSESETGIQTFAWEQYKLRPTQLQAALLAYSLQQAGDEKGARNLIDLHDLSGADEPMAQYYALKTQSAMGDELDETALAELQEARFELGPIRAAEVANW